MYQIAAPVWNRIASTVRLRHTWARTMFAMPQEELARALDEQAQRMTFSGTPARVIRAYQTVAPLLAENEALSRYFQKTADLQLRQALPEVTTPQEAVALAVAEFRLEPPEQTTLLFLLNGLTPGD